MPETVQMEQHLSHHHKAGEDVVAQRYGGGPPSYGQIDHGPAPDDPPGDGLEAGMRLAGQEEGGSGVEVADGSPQQGAEVAIFLEAGHFSQEGDNVTQ